METLLRLILLVPVTVTPQHFMEAGPVTVTAAIGSDVILPCVSTDEIDVRDLIIDWTKERDEIYIFRDEKPCFPHKDYKDRTSVFTEELQNNNMSLKLSGVKQTDGGQYCCCYDDGDNRRRCVTLTLNVTKIPANPSETQKHKGPDPHSHAAVTASVFLLLFAGLGSGIYVLWKCRNGYGAQDETQTNTETEQNRAETAALTVVTMSNGDNDDDAAE